MVTRRHLLGITAAAVMAQRTADAQSEPQVLFSNVRVFDGISPELSALLQWQDMFFSMV